MAPRKEVERGLRRFLGELGGCQEFLFTVVAYFKCPLRAARVKAVLATQRNPPFAFTSCSAQ